MATGAFAWWKGGPPERLGSLMLAVTWIGADVARSLSGRMVRALTLLVSDLLTSAGFLYIAIRYSSLWLGAAMIFRAIRSPCTPPSYRTRTPRAGMAGSSICWSTTSSAIWCC